MLVVGRIGGSTRRRSRPGAPRTPGRGVPISCSGPRTRVPRRSGESFLLSRRSRRLATTQAGRGGSRYLSSPSVRAERRAPTVLSEPSSNYEAAGTALAISGWPKTQGPHDVPHKAPTTFHTEGRVRLAVGRTGRHHRRALHQTAGSGPRRAADPPARATPRSGVGVAALRQPLPDNSDTAPVARTAESSHQNLTTSTTIKTSPPMTLSPPYMCFALQLRIADFAPEALRGHRHRLSVFAAETPDRRCLLRGTGRRIRRNFRTGRSLDERTTK